MSRWAAGSPAALGALALIGTVVAPAAGRGIPGLGVPTAGEQDSTQAPGVFADSLIFGQSAALSGPAQELGTSMNLGILAAFEEANRAGGVHGRALKLRAMDDGYEPGRAVANTQTLLEEGVFGLIGGVGTPTSNVAEPMASDARTPYIGPFTGAEFLRRARPYVVNVRASYYQETEEIVDRLVRDLGVRRVAVLYQDDSYGQAGLAGVRQALQSRGMSPVSEGAYLRNTVAVKRALLEIEEGDPQAVVMIGAYRPVATFVRWARQIRMNAIFVNVSFVGSNALLDELGWEGEGMVVSQVVPFPGDSAIPVVARYHEALAALDEEAVPGFVSLEGYLVGLLTVEGLLRAGPHPTRESFLDALRQAGSLDLGGFEVSYGEGDNQGSDRVFLTSIRGRRFVPVTRLRR